MVVAGLVLVVIAVLLFAVGIFGGGTRTVTLDLGLFDVTTSPLVVFVLGAVAVLVLLAGLGSMRFGARRARERRKDRQRVDALTRKLDAARKEAGMNDASISERDVDRDDGRPTVI